VQQFKNAVKGLLEKGADKLVLDVRNNLGGDLGAICEILDYLVPKGTLVRIYDKSGRVSALESDASSVELPMVVITNRYTSGVAELFACTLRDHNKAVLVGEKTYGKGVSQTVRYLNPVDRGEGALKLTTCKNFTPDGKWINECITPDIVLKNSDINSDIATDEAFLAAVESLKRINNK
jgi:carboxyl-terminal processing protease